MKVKNFFIIYCDLIELYIFHIEIDENWFCDEL